VKYITKVKARGFERREVIGMKKKNVESPEVHD